MNFVDQVLSDDQKSVLKLLASVMTADRTAATDRSRMQRCLSRRSVLHEIIGHCTARFAQRFH